MKTQFSGAQLALSTYESLAAHSLAMLSAARRSDWSAFVELEQECSSLVARLQVLQGFAELDAYGRKRRAELMRDVLAHDAAVREITQPWSTRISALAGHAGAGRSDGRVRS